MRDVKNLCILMIIVTISSCATSNNNLVRVSVNSIAVANSDKKKLYVLKPNDKEINEADLQYLEFLKYINKGLQAKGFVQPENPNEADLIIYFSYGNYEPETYTSTYSMPVYGQTGYSGSTTTGTINSFGGYTANTTLTPQYGITGYVPQTETTTFFGTWLVLAAYDLKTYFETNKFEQIWKTSISTSGTISDSRRVFPLTVASSFPKWATNTEQTISNRFDINSEELKKFKTDDSQLKLNSPQKTLSAGEQCSKLPLKRFPSSTGQPLSTDNPTSYKELYKDSEEASTTTESAPIKMIGAPVERITESNDSSSFKAILREHVPHFNCCYQKEVASNPNFPKEQRANLKLSIESNGKVSQSDVVMENTSSEALSGCLKYVLSEVQFPENMNGRKIEVNQPINFRSKAR